MEYKIVLTRNAEEDLENFILYLLIEKQNEQAAANLLNDFEATQNKLKYSAETLNYCKHPKLKKMGYRRMNFISHHYFILYRIVNNCVYIDNIFHNLQDYENKLE